MKYVRYLSYVLLAGAILTLTFDLWRGLTSESFVVTPLGELWYRLSPGTLNLTQAIIQRYLSVELWDPLAIRILTQPGWIVFGVPSTLLLLVSRRRLRRHPS